MVLFITGQTHSTLIMKCQLMKYTLNKKSQVVQQNLLGSNQIYIYIYMLVIHSKLQKIASIIEASSSLASLWLERSKNYHWIMTSKAKRVGYTWKTIAKVIRNSICIRLMNQNLLIFHEEFDTHRHEPHVASWCWGQYQCQLPVPGPVQWKKKKAKSELTIVKIKWESVLKYIHLG